MNHSAVARLKPLNAYLRAFFRFGSSRAEPERFALRARPTRSIAASSSSPLSERSLLELTLQEQPLSVSARVPPFPLCASPALPLSPCPAAPLSTPPGADPPDGVAPPVPPAPPPLAAWPAPPPSPRLPPSPLA